MAEANRVKFFLIKYFFLGNSLLLLIASTLFFLQNSESPKGKAVSFILLAGGLFFISLHFMVASNIKKVVVSKKKISIVDRGKVKSYNWDEVKSVKFIPFINMYRAHLKKKRKVYFLPPNNSEALFGMFTGKQDFIPKKVGKG